MNSISNVLEILDGSTKKDLSIEEVKLIKSKLDIASKWGSIKRAGKSAIPPGDATKAFNKINEYLKKLDIYIVEVGELECFNKNCGKHGPEQVAEVLEKYPDHKSEEYKSIREFVGGWNVQIIFILQINRGQFKKQHRKQGNAGFSALFFEKPSNG